MSSATVTSSSMTGLKRDSPRWARYSISLDTRLKDRDFLQPHLGAIGRMCRSLYSLTPSTRPTWSRCLASQFSSVGPGLQGSIPPSYKLQGVFPGLLTELGTVVQY